MLLPLVPEQTDLLAYRRAIIHSKMAYSGHMAVMGHIRCLGTARDSWGMDDNLGFGIHICTAEIAGVVKNMETVHCFKQHPVMAGNIGRRLDCF